jgi:hypothetical protein
MTAVSLLNKSVTKIDVIELDATISESHNGEVEVTEHPVEEGFNVTDHARAKPDVLTLTGIISNTPLNRTQALRKVADQSGFVFETSAGTAQKVGAPGYAEEAFAKLQALRTSGKVLTVQTRYRSYTDMLLTSLVVPRDASTGDALKFTAVFKHVRIVRNRETRAVAKEPKAKSKVAKGKQAPAVTPEATKKKSIAFELRENAGTMLKKFGILSP